MILVWAEFFYCNVVPKFSQFQSYKNIQQIEPIKNLSLVHKNLAPVSGMAASHEVSYFGQTSKQWTRHPIPGLESLPIEQKPTIVRFIIHKPSTHNKLGHPARGRSDSLTPFVIPPRLHKEVLNSPPPRHPPWFTP